MKKTWSSLSQVVLQICICVGIVCSPGRHNYKLMIMANSIVVKGAQDSISWPFPHLALKRLSRHLCPSWPVCICFLLYDTGLIIIVLPGQQSWRIQCTNRCKCTWKIQCPIQGKVACDFNGKPSVRCLGAQDMCPQIRDVLSLSGLFTEQGQNLYVQIFGRRTRLSGLILLLILPDTQMRNK